MATVLLLAGAGGNANFTAEQLGGEIVAGNTVVPVNYANFTIDPYTGSYSAATKLQEAILATPGEVIGFGLSLGAVGIYRWLGMFGVQFPELAERVSFVCGANSRRTYGGKLTALKWVPQAAVPKDTPFKVTDIKRAYDQWADVPTVLAEQKYVQAVVRWEMIHMHYEDVSLNDPANWKFVEGNVTYLMSPAGLRPELEKYFNRPEVPPNVQT